MTSVEIHFEDVPLTLTDKGLTVGGKNRIVSEISFTIVVEAETREKWSYADVLLWEVGSFGQKVTHFTVDEASELHAEIIGWVNDDIHRMDMVYEAICLEVLDNGTLVSCD